MQPNQPEPVGYNEPPVARGKKAVFIILAAVLVLVLLAMLGVAMLGGKKVATPTPTPANSAAAPEATMVKISAAGFVPATIKVKVGQSVSWTNDDAKSHHIASDPHPAHTGLAGLESDPLSKGESYGFTFEKAGTYTYHDHLDPLKLKGTVVVE